MKTEDYLIILKEAFEEGKDITNEIMEHVIPSFKFEGAPIHLKSSIHPFISNAIYKRDQIILEKERFETLITLARTIEDNQLLEEVIHQLKYKLILNKVSK